MREEKRGIGYFFLAFLPPIVCVILQVLIVYGYEIVVLAGRIAAGETSPMDPGYMEYVTQLATEVAPKAVGAYHIVGVLVFGLWYYLIFSKPRPGIKDSFKQVKVADVICAVLAGLGMAICAYGIIALECMVMPQKVLEYYEIAAKAGFGTDIVAIIAAVFLAPIGEELICRGLSFRFGKRAFGNFWVANIMQALFFGLIHANWVQGIYAFVLGLVLGLIVEKSGSIVPAMLLHFTMNLLNSTVVAMIFAVIWGDKLENATLGILEGLPVVLIGGAIIAGGFILRQKMVEKKAVA